VIKILIVEDGVVSAIHTPAELREGNADQPDVIDAVARLEAGDCPIVTLNLGSGGLTHLVAVDERGRTHLRPLVAYKGRMADVVAQSDADAAAERLEATEGRR